MKRTDIFENYYQSILNSDYSIKHWIEQISFRYEDLWAVGFSKDGKFLLSLTDESREIWSIDQASIVASEELENDFEYIDCQSHIAQGFGPCTGEDIRMVSIYGGGLTRI